MSNHGIQSPRGLDVHNCGGNYKAGRFGKLFPDLPRLISNPNDLIKVGEKNGPMDETAHGSLGSTGTPLGYVFLGQFIDHDITLDVTSSLDKVNDPCATKNFRTPALDLDCIYGAGPDASRHLYYHAPPSPSPTQKAINGKHLLTNKDDLVRALSDSPSNPNRAALVGDFRNDENRVLSQLQLTMHYFHNAVVDHLISNGVPDDKVFEEAQRITRWHYQWVIVHDFLPRMVGQKLVDDIMCNGRKIFHCKDGHPFIPIEFAVAAYRFGHTMVTMKVDYNSNIQGAELFGPELGNGFSVNKAKEIEWKHFFDSGAQKAGAVDIRLPQDLLDLPFLQGAPVHERSLATRNLLRGQSFGLPSGQNVHAAISEACGQALPQPSLSGLPNALVACTPLWLYILAEGDISGGKQLGPVGGRIIAEVLIGILECDKTSYLGSNRAWIPDELIATNWEMKTLLKFAGYGV